MRHNDPISHLITKEIKSVQVGQKLSEVRKILAEHHFHHIPVVDSKKLVGIISTADMLRMSFEAFGTDPRTMDAVLDRQFTVRDTMNTNLITLNQKSTVRDAVNLLTPGAIHSLPVVDDSYNLVGIVTSTDLIRYLGKQY